MTAEELVIQRLKLEEGFRATAYRDIGGRLTIGFGFCIDSGISVFAASALLTAQVDELMLALSVYSWFTALDAVRQSALLDVAFNDGLHGLLEFKKMIAALTVKDWQGAHDEMLNSAAAKELPSRYAPLAHMLLTGNS